MIGMVISIILGCLFVLVTTGIILVSFRERPSVKEKLKQATTRIEFPVQAELKELETKVHRQVQEIQAMAGAPAPVAACPPPQAPRAAAKPREHDTRMIRMVTEKAEEIQRLTEESASSTE